MTRQVPGQRSVARRSTCAGREQRRRADDHLAGDRAREVHAEERQRRVGHRVDLAAHERPARASRRYAPRNGTIRTSRPRSRGERQPVRPRARARDRTARGHARAVGAGRPRRGPRARPARARRRRGGSRRRAPRRRARRRPRRRRSRPSRCSASAAPTGRAAAGSTAADLVRRRAARRPGTPLARARRSSSSSRGRSRVAHGDDELAAARRVDPVCRRSTRTARPRPPRTAAPSASRARSRCRRG